MNPRTLCACQPVVFISSARVAPLGFCSRAMISAFLLPSRGLATVCLWALVACLPRVALRPDFGLGVATWGFSGAREAFFVAFPPESPRTWIRVQIRPTAVLELLNFSTGLTPDRLFQMST